MTQRSRRVNRHLSACTGSAFLRSTERIEPKPISDTTCHHEERAPLYLSGEDLFTFVGLRGYRPLLNGDLNVLYVEHGQEY